MWRRLHSWSEYSPTGRVVLVFCGPLFIVACTLVHSPNTTVTFSISRGYMVTGQLTLCGVELSQLVILFLSSVLKRWPAMTISQLGSSNGSYDWAANPGWRVTSWCQSTRWTAGLWWGLANWRGLITDLCWRLFSMPVCPTAIRPQTKVSRNAGIIQSRIFLRWWSRGSRLLQDKNICVRSSCLPQSGHRSDRSYSDRKLLRLLHEVLSN